MREVLDYLVQSLKNDRSVIIGAIVGSSGSAPRTSGARMLIDQDGTLLGTVGGGALEGACQKRAKEMFTSGEPHALLDFQLTAGSAADVGMICGGAVSVLLLRVGPSALDLFRQLQQALRDGGRPILLTSLPRNGAAGAMPRMSAIGIGGAPELPKDLLAEITGTKRRSPFLVECDGQQYFVEPLTHPGTVHLLGAGHVALATAITADFAGFEVVVLDDRAEFANHQRYPQAREIRVLGAFTDWAPELGADDYVVIVTRGHLHDREVLQQALKTRAGYIGMIGSSKKRQAIYQALRADGVTAKELERVHSPIGLTIGADTPEEIAISIVAELIQVRAGVGR
ncbi:MAG: XdhC family aldehyde oxidoreductase maturation factor [Desulfopila sp.]